MRLFIGIPLPEKVKDEIQGLRFYIDNARWSERNQYHITLKFIGEVDKFLMQDIAHALGSIHFPPFNLSLKGVGAFHSQRQARILWAGMEKGEELVRLNRKIERALEPLDLPAPNQGNSHDWKKFFPHVTLARLHKTPLSKVGFFLETFNLFQGSPFDVTEFQLCSSYLSSQGAQYEDLFTYTLRNKEQKTLDPQRI